MRKFKININGKSYEVEVEEVLDGRTEMRKAYVEPAQAVSVSEQDNKKEKKEAAPAPSADVPADAVKVTAPMPGTILDIKVNVGDSVTKGQVLLILEAMKMENEITAPADGKVVSVNVAKGSSVNSGDVLASVK